MNSRTTLLLLFCVLLVGAYIVLFEYSGETTEEKESRARRALQFKVEDISFLRIESEDVQVECEKTAGGWYLQEPVRARADDGEIERILYQLDGLIRGEVITAEERAAKGLRLKDYGLDEPRMTLILGSGGAHRTLLVGNEAPLGDGVYVKEDGRTEIVVVGKKLLDSLPADPNQLRDVVLFPYDRASVKRVGIRRADGYLQLAQTSAGVWTIQQPIVGRANAVEVMRLLDALFMLNIERFVADGVGDPAAYGLTDPQIQVTLWTDEAEAGRTLMLGGTLKDDEELIYAKWEDANSIYAITRSVNELLNLGLTSLRERSLLPLPTMGIASVRIRRGEELLSLVKEGGDDWAIAAPRQEKADRERIQSLLERWSRVRIEDFVDDNATNLVQYGLEPPAMTVEFSSRIHVEAAEAASSAAKEKGWVVHIGSASDDGKVLVRLASERAVYAVNDDVLEGLSLDPLDFRERRVLYLRKQDVVRVVRSAGAVEQAVARTADGAAFALARADAGTLDPEALDVMLETACYLTAQQFVTDSPSSLADYGLESPSAVVTLDLSGEAGISKTLLMGAAADGGVYAMIRGQDVIFTLNRQQATALTNSLLVEASAEEMSSTHDQADQAQE